MVSEASSVQEFAKGYFRYLTKLLDEIDTDAIAAVIKEFEISRDNENTVFIIGNGGSAATASHIANDIGLDVMKKSSAKRSVRVLSLTDSMPVITAIANDDGYENIFLHQLKIHYRPGDKLLAISASGNSPNVISAVEWVKQQGGTIMGLVGFDGGRLRDSCDILVHIKTPKGEYGPVEDIHMIMDHLISTWLLFMVQ